MLSRKNLIGNQYIMKKNLKTKIKSYNGKINTNFTIIKYQEKVLNLFVYQ